MALCSLSLRDTSQNHNSELESWDLIGNSSILNSPACSFSDEDWDLIPSSSTKISKLQKHDHGKANLETKDLASQDSSTLRNEDSLHSKDTFNQLPATPNNSIPKRKLNSGSKIPLERRKKECDLMIEKEMKCYKEEKYSDAFRRSSQKSLVNILGLFGFACVSIAVIFIL